jgi:cbb3-type cytochrome oxidase maturation protein
MDTLYLLLPMAVLLVLGLIGLFAWALDAGQFEDLEREGWRAIADEPGCDALDPGQPVNERAFRQ